MKHRLAAWIAKLNGPKAGLTVLATLSAGTALALLPPGSVLPLPPAVVAPVVAPVVTTDDQGVKLRVKPSQTKIVRGSADELFLDVDIEVPAPTVATGAARKPTDMVLVLDRSGSMADGNKLSYAKAAMKTLVDRLGDQDRIGLVTFDDRAIAEFSMEAATREGRQRLVKRIDQLETGGGTNMGDGFIVGRTLLGPASEGRSARVILLSDGNANVGIADPEGLTQLVKSIGMNGAVVSTIGMGLDFNETLLARLADHGMGNYSYLASLTNLGQLLEKDLGDARAQFAAASYLLLEAGEGVTVTDAAGYPIERDPGGRFRVPLGQLLEGSSRNLTVSLTVPTSSLGERKLAAVELSYDRGGQTRVVKAGDQAFAVQIVPPERSDEAVASVDAGVFRKSWVTNNVGRMKKELSTHLRDGNKEAAQKAVSDYKARLGAASAAAGVDTKSAELDDELTKLETLAQDAFEGSASEQNEKKKAYSKDTWSSGISSQRASGGKKP